MVVGCATQPSAAPMIGRWGSETLGLVATPTAVEIHLACSAKAEFRGPLQPDENGRFELIGRVHHFYGAFGIELRGLIRGASLSVTVTEIYDGGGRETEREELRRGVTPDFSNVICLA
jgi:hypothetical protein